MHKSARNVTDSYLSSYHCYAWCVHSAQDGRSSTQHGRPSAGERANVAHTRSLIDKRGRQDAVVDDTACAARLNKTLFYLCFGSKEEIFGAEFLQSADPVAALRPVCERYIEFCLDYPAFPDRGKALTQRTAAELPEQVSGAVLLRLGRAMAATLSPLARIFAIGAERGVFAIDDPVFMPNRVNTQVLGCMHFARVGIGARESAPGMAKTFGLRRERECQARGQQSLALALVTAGASA